MTIFEALEKAPAPEPKKTGFLHRSHLYKGDEIAFTVIPSIHGAKLLRIKPGDPMVQTLTDEEYQDFIKAEGLREVPR
jgi:hypothetical protein